MKRGVFRNFKLVGMWAINLPVVLLSYLIVWLDRYIRFPLSFPRDIEDLARKKQWCLKALEENGVLPKEAEVYEYKVTPLKQEMIFRSIAGVIEIKYNHHGNHNTLKFFAKFAPTKGTVWVRTVFNMQLNHLKEIFFNREFVSDACVAAPTVYCAKVSFVTGNLCLITEYMDDYAELIEFSFKNFPVEELNLVLDGMASLHACYWKDTSKRMNKIFSIGETTVDLFDSLVAFSWSIPARKILVQSWNIMNEHQTVLHGDARIGNMMFPVENAKGRFVFIDWQAVRKGKGVYDLAYFLNLSLTSEYRAGVEQQTIKTYYERLMDNGVSDYSWKQLEEDYRHACLCVVVLLSLPMLSGEASAEGDGAIIFAFGMNIWRKRLQKKFSDFDYKWMAERYGITEQEGRDAIEEMLDVIYKRLKKIAGDREFENLGEEYTV